MSTQLVYPNPSTQDGAGWCLRFTQTVWGAPVRYNSAWDAWNATTLKHDITEDIPNDVGVVVWFSHYGSYGSPPYYANWGHVVSWIPGRGYLSSPRNGYGQDWSTSIGEVEAKFNCRYVGWTEDINGLRVAEITQPKPPEPEKPKMTPEQASQLSDIYSAIFKKEKLTTYNLPGGLLRMAELDYNNGVKVGSMDYEKLASEIVKQLPEQTLTYDDVVRAIKSVTYKAE